MFKELINKTAKVLTGLKKKALLLNKSKRFLTILIVLLVVGLIYTGRSLIFAAWVGSRPIFRYTLVKELEKQGGKQVLDALLEKSLVEQEGVKSKIQVSDEEIDMEIAKIEEVVKAQGMTLDSALSLSGMNKNDLLGQIKLQMVKTKILKDKVAVSDEEIKTYYDTNKMTEVFETVKDSIKTEIINTKLQEEYTKWISEIKAKAKILYFVNY